MRIIRILISVLIIILICTMAVRSLNYLAKDFVYNVYTNNCKIIYHEISGRNIIIRIDDIQAYYLREVQMSIIEDALNRNKTISLAVIPFGLHNDKEMFKFLEENRCKVEIGLHGYNNTDYEFLNVSYEEANEKVKNGLFVLNQIEPTIITFIPPNNECSDTCRKAVYDNDISIISSGFKNKEFGFSVSTYDWKSREFVDYKKVLQVCENELDKNETCIIMIHPQDYVTNNELDPKKYEHYIKLLDGIDRLNATVVTFRDLYYENVIKLN